MEFEWDLSKEVENLRKHGITFSESVESFLDPYGFQLVDAKHSVRESGSSGWGGFQRVGSSPHGLRNEAVRFALLDRPTGGNFGGCTMREPKLADLMVGNSYGAPAGLVGSTKSGEDHRHHRYEKSPRSQGCFTANRCAVSSPGEPSIEEGPHKADHHGLATGSLGARSEADETNPGCLTSRQ
jgi:uncharacterized DUF497 family protein